MLDTVKIKYRKSHNKWKRAEFSLDSLALRGFIIYLIRNFDEVEFDSTNTKALQGLLDSVDVKAFNVA